MYRRLQFYTGQGHYTERLQSAMFISIRPDIEKGKKKRNRVVQAAPPSAHLSLSHLKQISDERGGKCLMVVQHNAFLPPFYFTLNSLIKQPLL